MKYSQEKVKENIEISKGIYKLTIQGKFKAKQGQFYMLKSWDEGLILPRPISVHDVYDDKIEFLYAVVGKGTKILKDLEPGDKIEMMGSLGNGFDIDRIKGKVAIVSGGIGIAPLKYLVKGLENCKIDLYAGFKDKDYVLDEFKNYVESVNIATESGKVGHKGYVTELLEPDKYDVVISCGPEIMMKKVIEMCLEKDVEIYVSMENKMACGVGACLVCTCRTRDGNKRTCKDGPVFNGRDLFLND